MQASNEMDRRRFLGACAAVPVLGGLMPAQNAHATKSPANNAYQIYWGDLHNHNAVGYAKGSLERSFRIARGLLDFHTFTPHSQWPDMPAVSPETRAKFEHGFQIVRERWPEVQRMCAEYHEPGRFVTFPGYEWHSSAYGDYCLIFPRDNAPLKAFGDLKALQAFARDERILLIPHHPGNRQGNRGANFDTLTTDVSPVLEIYSEWGNAERDDAPYPYVRHSHGGVWTKNTWQYALEAGLRLGAVAGTDDHFGYPGAYREGLTAILAPELTREALFDALKQRRTYGVTGDRIALDYRLNSHFMGESLPFSEQRHIAVNVAGWGDIEEVEVVKNNRVIHRDHPIDRPISEGSWSKPVLVRMEFGWGPWASLDAARICDWRMRVEIAGGVINAIQPCFQSGPCEESKFDRIYDRTAVSCAVESFTSRRQAFAEDDTKGLVLNLSAKPDTRLRVDLEAPVPRHIDRPLSDFVGANDIFWTGSYPSESLRIQRIAFAQRHSTQFEITDTGNGETVDWYYARVRQANGQLAWSSPIWVEAKG